MTFDETITCFRVFPYSTLLFPPYILSIQSTLPWPCFRQNNFGSHFLYGLRELLWMTVRSWTGKFCSGSPAHSILRDFSRRSSTAKSRYSVLTPTYMIGTGWEPHSSPGIFLASTSSTHCFYKYAAMKQMVLILSHFARLICWFSVCFVVFQSRINSR